jgi:DNA-binding FrmR family transcriptional regulator
VGTINKVIQMIEEDKYCVDIASQVNAAVGLLKSVNTTLLENHLACCGPKFLNATEQ